MSNEHIKDEISAYLSGGLTEVRNRQIEAHAASCEKCHQALNKARAKQARQKREALKKASPDSFPNLFLARQGKEAGIDRPASGIPWIFVGLVLAAGGGYLLYHHYSAAPHAVDVPSAGFVSTAAVAGGVPTAAVSADTSAGPVPAVSAPPVAADENSEPPAPVMLKAQQEWRGMDSGVKIARVLVVRTQSAWEKLWTEMQQKDPLPTVNFSKHVVVGIFAGESAVGATIVLGPINEMEDDVTVPYQITPLKETAAPAPLHPYLLSQLPRVDKKIRLIPTETQP